MMRETSSAASLRTCAALALFFVAASGCRSGTAGPVEVRLAPLAADRGAAIEVVNLPDDVARAVADRTLTRDEWTGLLRVSVGEGQPAMLGEYDVRGSTLRFTPMFPLDAGRQYRVEFNASALPGASASASVPLITTLGLPGKEIAPSTVVSHVFPSTAIVPENQLRLYVHFSAPMGRSGGLPFIKLLDDEGKEVVDPFLPLDAEFWNDDHTGYTVFFDPGRQKRGILPNQQMGRSLEPGRQYTLVVAHEWRDAEGLPLREDFKRQFRVGPADERPLDVSAWRITAPAVGTRDEVNVAFDEPLDHGLLLRALGVTGSDGRFLDGDVTVEAGESRWSFVPRTPWTAGTYQVTALAMLEDLAGNRIGRAFEVDTFTRSDSSPEPERTSIPFSVR